MILNRKYLFQYILVALILLFFSACNNHSHEDLQIFRYNESAGLTTLDPAFAKDQSIIWPCRQLYNGLVQLSTSEQPGSEPMQVLPCIAKSWTVSPDGQTYTFTLRSDVRFHNGRQVVANDFVYSFGRILDPSVASPGVWIFSSVKDFSAIDDTTFVIRLKEPFAPFLSLLGMVYCSVVPREVVEQYGKDFRSHPCGTGPFRFQYWKEGVKLVLRRNPDYFERDAQNKPLPYLDAIAVTFIVDKQTAFLEFVKGNLDFLNSLDASYKDELLTLDGNLKPKYVSRLVMTSTPYLNTEYLGFLMDGENSPLHDVRIRQAINYGFDRRKMMRYLRNNIGQPGTMGFVPPSLLEDGTQRPSYYEYNPGKSRRLLSEAGYPDGQGLPRLKLGTTAGYLDLCKYLQQQLGLLGIDVQVDVNPPAALREQIAQGRLPWFRGSWVADYLDAENYLSLFYSPNRAPAGPNYSHFSSKKYDRLYEEARRCTDPARRMSLYQTMDSMVMQQAPVLVLYYDQILHFTHPNVKGLRTDPMNTLDLRHVTIQP